MPDKTFNAGWGQDDWEALSKEHGIPDQLKALFNLIESRVVQPDIDTDVVGEVELKGQGATFTVRKKSIQGKFKELQEKIKNCLAKAGYSEKQYQLKKLGEQQLKVIILS